MTRKVTLIYELPEELCQVLEQKAATEDRPWQDVVTEYLARHRRRPRPLTDHDASARKAAFERQFGAWDSGRQDSSSNAQIDADLAREYEGRSQQG